MHDVSSFLYRLVSHPALIVCGAVGLAGACMDLDHLVEGLSRQTHLLVVIAAWACAGLYIALCSRRPSIGVLGVRA